MPPRKKPCSGCGPKGEAKKVQRHLRRPELDRAIAHEAARPDGGRPDVLEALMRLGHTGGRR